MKEEIEVLQKAIHQTLEYDWYIIKNYLSEESISGILHHYLLNYYPWKGLNVDVKYDGNAEGRNGKKFISCLLNDLLIHKKITEKQKEELVKELDYICFEEIPLENI